ncbi:hypothetical protein CRE_09515 [Caenorhabditis remanei]|uniref:Transcription initiation factor TFIID subunit 11 n=2 Tax=Caenorhabditis remanei TaxID=31234 RepID=E3MJ62_CAERE|nr:hypothetical protein CRE_09515 [Caenorhabditis remanei]
MNTDDLFGGVSSDDDDHSFPEKSESPEEKPVKCFFGDSQDMPDIDELIKYHKEVSSGVRKPIQKTHEESEDKENKGPPKKKFRIGMSGSGEIMETPKREVLSTREVSLFNDQESPKITETINETTGSYAHSNLPTPKLLSPKLSEPREYGEPTTQNQMPEDDKENQESSESGSSKYPKTEEAEDIDEIKPAPSVSITENENELEPYDANNESNQSSIKHLVTTYGPVIKTGDDVKKQEISTSSEPADSLSEVDQIAQMKRLILLGNMSTQQLEQYDAYRRSRFQKSTIRKLVKEFTGGMNVNDNVVITIGALAKMLVGDIVEEALDIRDLNEDESDLPLEPHHIRSAYMKVARHGLI